ncbi:unnamed protein product [Ascophyllum nodosum]
MAWRRKRKNILEGEEARARDRGAAAGMQHHRALRKLILESTGRGFGIVKRVYVIPGGGPGSAKDAGYPPWTAQRVEKALQRYDVKFADTTAFLALGAGSMNAPGPRGENGRLVFESTRIAEELARGGVPPGSIIADFASWDTVGNAWFARMAVEAILDMSFRVGDKLDEPHPALPLPAAKNQSPDAETEAEEKLVGGGGSRRRHGEDEGVEADDGDTKGGFEGGFPGHDEVKRRAEEEDEGGGTGAGRGQGEEKLPAARAGEAYGGGEVRRWMFDWKARKARARRGPLNVTMFVSDFHAERMDAVFQWVFGLEPSLLRGKTTVTTVSIDTPVKMWAKGPEERQARLAHERKATDQARLRAREIRTVEEFRAFMTLGGHQGYFKLTHGRYQASAGGGWGGAS